jgi:hypothetical protein
MSRHKFVAIGDLNAADDVLVDILRGTKLINRDNHWIGGKAHLVQIGDIWNRGPGAKKITELLLQLQPEAEATGGKISIILGNHEVMTALGVEAYCTTEEYLAFASLEAQERWPKRVHKAMMKIYRSTKKGEIVPPLAPRVEQWKMENVPGKPEMRRALSHYGRLGRAMRKWPVALLEDGLVFTHAALTPTWAEKGIDALNQEARQLWATKPNHVVDLPRDSMFRDDAGPLWDRSFAMEEGATIKKQVETSLKLLQAQRMIIGHTKTSSVPGGQLGRISMRFKGKVICIDVGLTSGEETPRVALLVERGRGFEWSSGIIRPLW